MSDPIINSIADALEVRAEGHDEEMLRRIEKRYAKPAMWDTLTELANGSKLLAAECRALAKLLRANELPGVDWTTEKS